MVTHFNSWYELGFSIPRNTFTSTHYMLRCVDLVFQVKTRMLQAGPIQGLLIIVADGWFFFDCYVDLLFWASIKIKFI